MDVTKAKGTEMTTEQIQKLWKVRDELEQLEESAKSTWRYFENKTDSEPGDKVKKHEASEEMKCYGNLKRVVHEVLREG